MKICYIDESGNNADDPCLVMVGIVVDAYRLNRTREEFADIFDEIQGLFDENLRELKGAKMIFGRDRWRKVDPELRKRIAGFFCNWIGERKHHIALAAVDRNKLSNDGPRASLRNAVMVGSRPRCILLYRSKRPIREGQRIRGTRF